MRRLPRALLAVLWPPRALWLHLRVTFWLAVAWVLYRRLPLDRFLAAWTPRRSGRRGDPPEKVIEAVERVLSGLRRLRCFARCLLIYRLLRMQGHDLFLCIGVKPSPDHCELLGHAWLEDANGPCWPYGDDGSSYHVVFRHPPSGG